jgi:hypothetical protein
VKIYISSTFKDLGEHRVAVDRSLRRMGHDVIGMEQYVAEGSKPVDRCLADVETADVYVLILAWRYGYAPVDPSNPLKRSMTELEFQHAKAKNKTVLAFLLDPDAPWPPSLIDAVAAVDSAANITNLRHEVGSAYLAGLFRTADDLASQVTAAVAVQGLSQKLVERVLVQTSVTANAMGDFGSGSQLFDTTVIAIKKMVKGAGLVRALVLDLGEGDQWWSTRLFLLASLLKSLTAVRQIVFRQSDGRFAGMASPDAVVDGLSAEFRELAELRHALDNSPVAASKDTARETDRQVNSWNHLLAANGWDEHSIKVGIRPGLLGALLGERLVTRCLKLEGEQPSMAQVQQIVDSLLPDVPIEWSKSAADPPGTPQLQLDVVDRDAFALGIAREWVLSGLPRTRLL